MLLGLWTTLHCRDGCASRTVYAVGFRTAGVDTEHSCKLRSQWLPGLAEHRNRCGTNNLAKTLALGLCRGPDDVWSVEPGDSSVDSSVISNLGSYCWERNQLVRPGERVVSRVTKFEIGAQHPSVPRVVTVTSARPGGSGGSDWALGLCLWAFASGEAFREALTCTALLRASFSN
ncbi:hypothetical protein G7046_g636 [Stylonectria norvegica]|nr:hypothetical protein G7046_g636 [Stylonectria norvegica]